MRRALHRLGTTAALVGAMIAVGSSAVVAARPVVGIEAITVTAAGGTWPHCLQDVTVRYSADRRVAKVLAYAWQDRCPYTYDFVYFTAPVMAAQTSATVRVSADYSLFERWGWTATLLDRRGSWLSMTLPTTTRFTFTPGVCPARGVIAVHP